MSAVDPASRVLWVPLGGLFGGVVGAGAGAPYGLVVATSDPVAAGRVGAMVLGALLGAWVGAWAGGVVGLFVGAELLLLLGTVDSPAALGRRAFAWGLVLPPATLVGLLLALGGGDAGVGLSLSADVLDWLGAWPLVLASGVGGPLARRLVS